MAAAGVRAAPGLLDTSPADHAPLPATPCDALFAAVLADDEVDPETPLPAAIQLDVSQDTLMACFRLAFQLWDEGFDRASLIGLATTALRDRTLDARDRQRLKHIRAKFKHLRYAHALYGAAHRYPRLLDAVTTTMGHLQDGCRNRRPLAVVRAAALLRLMLLPRPARWLRAEAERLAPTSPAAFRALLASDVAELQGFAAQASVDGHRFHAVRKRIGRQVSFWDTLRTLDPTPDRFRLSRVLSAINGLMGDYHDGLVLQRAGDRASYRAPFTVPGAIRGRIDALLPCYFAALVTPPGGA